MDALRKQLDVLMGANRNGDVTEINHKYFDRDVCRFFLSRLCPHELFELTVLKRSSNGGGAHELSNGSPTPSSKVLTVGELMRVQMRVSETVDSRIRRAFLRIAASHVSPFLFPSDRF